MAQFGWSQAVYTLQEDYKPVLDTFNDFCFLISQLETDTENIEMSDGLRAYHPVHVGRSSGVGAVGRGGTVPTPGYQNYNRILIPIRKNYGAIRVNADVIEAMRSGRTSWFQAVDNEIERIRKDATKDRNRQAWGTSNGVIAQCGTTSSSTTVQLASTTTVTQMRQLGSFDGGIVIDIGTVADPDTIADGVTISAYSETNKTITISGSAVTTSSSHYVFRHDAGGASDNSGNATDGQLELTGMQTIVDDTAVLHTLNPSSVTPWKALVDSNSGTNRAWSQSLTNKNIAEAEHRSGKQVDLLVANPKVGNSIAATFQSMGRMNDNVDLKGGWTGLRYSTPLEGGVGAADRVLVGDHDCPENRLFGLAKSSLKRYETHGWKFSAEDGSVLWRSPDRDDSYETWLAIRDEIACVHRCANFVIEDLDQP